MQDFEKDSLRSSFGEPAGDLRKRLATRTGTTLLAMAFAWYLSLTIHRPLPDFLFCFAAGVGLGVLAILNRKRRAGTMGLCAGFIILGLAACSAPRMPDQPVTTQTSSEQAKVHAFIGKPTPPSHSRGFTGSSADRAAIQSNSDKESGR